MNPEVWYRGVPILPDAYVPERVPPKPWRLWLWRWVGQVFDFPEPVGARRMYMVGGVIICHPKTFAVVRDQLRERGLIRAN